MLSNDIILYFNYPTIRDSDPSLQEILPESLNYYCYYFIKSTCLFNFFNTEKPVIIRGPNRYVNVFLADTIVLECESYGFPTPFINWRLNWGHICEEPRCYSSNNDGKGVLVITNSSALDAGAYSCEALNSQGRVFADYDSIVTVQKKKPIEQNMQSNTSLKCDDRGSYTKDEPCFCKV